MGDAEQKRKRDKIKQIEKVRRERSTEPGDDEEDEAWGVRTGVLFGCSKMQQMSLCLSESD